MLSHNIMSWPLPDPLDLSSGAAARLVLGERGAPGHDLVLIARNETGTCSFPTLLAELDAALRRTGARP